MRFARRSLTGLTIAALLAATTGAASADGWRHRGAGGYGGPRHYHAEPAPPYRHPGGFHYGQRKRDNTARNVILGMSAVILGAILSEAAREKHREYLNDH